MDLVPSRSMYAVPLVVVALVVAVAAMSFTRHEASSGPARNDASSSFGMGRKVALVTPGAKLSGALALPQGVPTAAVTWTVSQGESVLAAGRGAAWSFAAPDSGTVTLAARLAGRRDRTSLVFHVVATSDVAGWAARSTGRVLVDGAPAIQGEALAQGTLVDARAGVLSMQVRARTDSDLTGTIKLEGTRLELRATAGSDGAMHNVVRMEREAGAEQLLVAEVEHLDGTRYVQVETPDAVAMVKGTRFLVRLDQDGTDVAVDHGWVVVRNRVDTKAQLLDVRDESQTYVPRVPHDGDAATGGADLVRPLKGFDGIVDEHRGRMEREVRGRDGLQQPAPQGSQPGPDPGSTLTAPGGDGGQPGTPVSNPDGDGDAKRPPCGPPRCPAPTTMAPPATSPAPGTTVPPIKPPSTSVPAPGTSPDPDTTKPGTTGTTTAPPTEPAPRPCATCAPATSTAPPPTCVTCAVPGTVAPTRPNTSPSAGTSAGSAPPATTSPNGSCATGSTCPASAPAAAAVPLPNPQLPMPPRPGTGTIAA